MGRRPKPSGAIRRGGRVAAPDSGEGLSLAELARRCPRTRMSEAEREAWTRYSRQLAGVRQVSETDLAALELLCYAYADLIEAREALRENGRTHTETTAGGAETLKARPEVAMASDAAKRMRSLLVELGMTPASRGRVERTPRASAKRPEDPWAGVGDVPPPVPAAPVPDGSASIG
jgi:P27 family predicted phage terminase small subunit